MGKTAKDKGEDKSGSFNISMILIIISAIIIGFLSPSGIFKCAFTFGVFYIFLNFHSIIHPIVTPIFNFIHKAGKTRLKDATLINPRSISTILLLILFIQCFVVNYLFHRYTGILVLDPFAIYFWIASYGLNIFYNNVYKTKNSNFTLRALPTVASLIITVICMQILKNNQYLIHTPEQYAATGENFIFRQFFTEYLPPRYRTRL
jgi:hypothetical protein